MPATKETTSQADVKSAKLALRSGLVKNYGSGIFGYTPVGQKVLDNITEEVREEMLNIGAQEVSLPALQNSGIWKESGRWEAFEGEMFTFDNRDGKEMCLAPTHEEGMAEMVRGGFRSHNDLPTTLFQIGRKYRDDHPRNGLLRTKEFVMKDAYSFHSDETSLDETYQDMREAYVTIFDELDLDYKIIDADPGEMGGTGSEEFIAPAEIGSDEILACVDEDCNYGTKDFDIDECLECGDELEEENGIEIGHIFKLGTRYSEPLQLQYDTGDNDQEDIIMGSYGIGISRVIPTIIEQNHDENGIKWPEEVAPFERSIIGIGQEGEAKAKEIYEQLPGDNTLLYDEMSVGERFAESDLAGIPYKIIVGPESLENEQFEVESREGVTDEFSLDAVENPYKHQETLKRYGPLQPLVRF